MSQPLVTIVAICHNHVRWVEECLESIRRQTYGNVECFIINNTQTDGSLARIEAFVARTGFDCTVIQNEQPLSVVENCNLGLDLAEGEFYAPIACDDEMIPDRLARQVAEFRKRGPGIVCVYGEMELIDETGEMIGKFYSGKRTKAAEPLPEGTLLYENSSKCFVGAPAAMVRTAAVRAVGGYDTRYHFEDWPLFLQLGRMGGTFVGLTEPLVRYRVLTSGLGKVIDTQRIRELYGLFTRNRDILIPYPSAVRKWRRFAALLRETNIREGAKFEMKIMAWAGVSYLGAVLRRAK